MPAPSDPVASLCPACGLCCNGVLFADVELQHGDDSSRLAALGLALKRKGKKRCFVQPCSGYDGRLCRFYSERPQRCRAFACRLLQRVQGGQTSIPAALKTIRQVRRQAELVRRLVRRLGQRDEQMPLSRRYAQVIRQAWDFSGEKRVLRLRGDLLLAVHELVLLLEREILVS